MVYNEIRSLTHIVERALVVGLVSKRTVLLVATNVIRPAKRF